MAKIGHNAKARAFAKWSVWVKNKKCQKGAKNGCATSDIRVVVWKKPLQKHLILEKGEYFENGQNWPQRKG